MSLTADKTAFPCQFVIEIPFPTVRLAKIAERTLLVDEELSALVCRQFRVSVDPHQDDSNHEIPTPILHILYAASTPRMLRVSLNGCLASLRVILSAMAELDEGDEDTNVSVDRQMRPTIESEAEDHRVGGSGGWKRVQGLTPVSSEQLRAGLSPLSFDAELL